MCERTPDTVEELRKALVASEERYMALLADVDRRARELAEREFRGEMTRVSSELAHDLRGPLQTITNSIYLMERKPGDTTYVPKIGEALRHATALLDGFRDYYRGHEITPMPGNVNRVIEKALEDVPVSGGVSVVKRLDSSIPDGAFDPSKMRRVFAVIIGNAVEAMPGGGSLAVSTHVEGDRVVVEIADTGSGIPVEMRERVFVPFGSKKRGGFGLGLAASKRVVEAHGGGISFDSEVGRGTTFRVSMPLSRAR
ncbi:MAG: HAMP domain-containing sensor histidine kinase [Candidatus Bathyarchaeia archaeon]